MTTQPTGTREQEHDGASLISILDELADIVTHARAMPMSASVMVNRAEMLDLLDAARAVVPDEIRAADDIVAGAEATEEQARGRAADVVAQAEARAQELVSEEQVVALAEQRAEQIQAEAKATARKLAADANAYCERQLSRFEADLEAIQKQVRAGREALTARTDREQPEDQDGG